MIVFALRHADRQPDPTDDLTLAGAERARLLARMLAESGVSFACCSDTVRARRTLEPLHQKLGNALTVNEVALGNPGAGIALHVQRTVQAVRSQPTDAVVAIVGHSDTVEPIIAGLGGGQIGQISTSEFDKLFVLFIGTDGVATLARLRYGAATP